MNIDVEDIDSILFIFYKSGKDENVVKTTACDYCYGEYEHKC
jgi:hypothetical protein